MNAAQHQPEPSVEEWLSLTIKIGICACCRHWDADAGLIKFEDRYGRCNQPNLKGVIGGDGKCKTLKTLSTFGCVSHERRETEEQ